MANNFLMEHGSKKPYRKHTKPPTTPPHPSNSSVSRHHLVNWGQNYFPLWSSHATDGGPVSSLPGRPPRSTRYKVYNLQWEADYSLPYTPPSLLPTHAICLTHAPLPTHYLHLSALHGLLGFLLGFFFLIIFVIKYFTQGIFVLRKTYAFLIF